MYLDKQNSTLTCPLFSDQFLRSHLPQTESVFRGKFLVRSGDFIPEGVAEAGSYIHDEKSKFYGHKIDLVMSGSRVAKQYMHSEVFLLEG